MSPGSKDVKRVSKQASTKVIKCMYTNVNSLTNKQNELKCRVKQYQPDVIG